MTAELEQSIPIAILAAGWLLREMIGGVIKLRGDVKKPDSSKPSKPPFAATASPPNCVTTADCERGQELYAAGIAALNKSFAEFRQELHGELKCMRAEQRSTHDKVIELQTIQRVEETGRFLAMQEQQRKKDDKK